MGRDQIVGLVLKEGSLEWSVLRSVREQTKVILSDSVEFVGEPGVADAVLPDDLSNRVKTSCGGGKGHVALGLSSSQLLLRVVNLPSVDPAEIGSMVELQMDKISPFPVESMVISYEVLQTRENQSRVLIGAAKRAVVESAGTLLSKTGLRIASVDATVLGWLRLLRGANKIAGKGCQAVLLMDGSAPEVVVMLDGIPVAFRSLGDIGGLEGQELVSEIASEINYTLMSLELEHGTVAVDSISVWHFGAIPAELASALSKQYACGVDVHELASLGKVSEGIAARSVEREEHCFDLRPDSWRKASQAREFGGRLLVAGGVALGIWLAMAAVLFGALSYQKWQLGRLKAEQNKWSRPALEVRAMRRRVAMIAKYTNTTHSALECLRDVTVRMPPAGIDLTSFSYKKGEDVKITGEANSAELVLSFNEKLNGSELFPEVKSGPMSVTKERRHRFSIDLTLPGDG